MKYFAITMLGLLLALSTNATANTAWPKATKASIPTMYTGSLSTEDGTLTGNGTWASGSQISWEISKEKDIWNYKYTISVLAKDISHLIVEASETFGAGDIFNLQGNIPIKIETYSEDQGNPGMPEEIYGIKFDELEGTTLVIDFCSHRDPVPGNFYAKGGKTDKVFNTMWNSGNVILRPDTIPEPATMSLLLIGGAGMLLLRRRHRA